MCNHPPPLLQVQIEVTDENPAMFHLEWLDSCSERVNFQGQATDELLAEVGQHWQQWQHCQHWQHWQLC